jgi:UDP-N-acetylmuramate dehydrogenase
VIAAAHKAELAALLGDAAEIRWDESMARHTTLRIGGPVDAWIAPRHYEALCNLRKFCASHEIPSRAFGSGSNLLVRDGGIRGVAIALRHMARVERIADDEDGANLWVDGGASTGKVLAFATIAELGGVEFLGGVPGTVGGGMIMNAGTYLGEFKDVTTRVFSVNERGDTIVRDNAECGFVYRASAIPANEVVTHARLRLTPRPREAIKADVESLRARRKDREPSKVHNSGSTFKNPPNDYAGRLIEACGLKGREIGAAQVSPVHANWLVNNGKASARDLLQLIELVRGEVEQKFHVRLELEVKVVGEDL